MEQQNKIKTLTPIMTYGAILGAALAGFTLLLYVMHQMFSTSLLFIRLILFVYILIYSQKALRDKYFNGQVTYKMALSLGFSISVFAGIIISFLIFVLYYTDPNLVEETFTNMEEALLQLHIFTEDKIEFIVQNSRENYNPLATFFSGIFEFAFKGLLISLITSIFVKRENNSFENTMKEVE